METFQRIFCNGASDGNSCSSKSEDIRSSMSRNGTRIKLLVAAPRSSGRTSLLFEAAFQFAAAGETVIFISPKQITKLPLLLNGRDQPSVEILNKIQIIYLANKNEFLEFMASIHLKYRHPIGLLIVDDIDSYYDEMGKRNELGTQAKIFAYLFDAFAFLDQLGKTQNDGSVPNQECKLICSITALKEAITQKPQIALLEKWFKNLVTVKPTDEHGHFNVTLHSKEHTKAKSLPLYFGYVIHDNKIDFIANT